MGVFPPDNATVKRPRREIASRATACHRLTAASARHCLFSKIIISFELFKGKVYDAAQRLLDLAVMESKSSSKDFSKAATPSVNSFAQT